MADTITGSWVVEKKENYDAFLKEMGMGMIKRQIASKITAQIEIEETSPNCYKQKVAAGPFSRVVEYKLDEEYEADSPDGGIIKGTWKKENGIFVGNFVQVKSNKKLFVTRKLENEQMVETSEIGGAKVVRYFKRTK